MKDRRQNFLLLLGVLFCGFGSNNGYNTNTLSERQEKEVKTGRYAFSIIGNKEVR